MELSLRLMITAMLANIALVSAHQDADDYKKMIAKIDHYNLMEKCYGKDLIGKLWYVIEEGYRYCETLQTPTSIITEVESLSADEMEALSSVLTNPSLVNMLSKSGRRKKRQEAKEAIFPLSEEEKEEIKEEVEEHKEYIVTEVGNLSCILTRMEYLKSDGVVDINDYSFDKIKELIADSPAGQDDDFVTAVSDAATHCYEKSQQWSQNVLDKDPHMKLFGRQMVFFDCIFKAREDYCYKWQMFEGMRDIYGVDLGVDNLGLEGNKYDAAGEAWIEVFEHADHVYQYIDDFFWNKRV
eukprot:TRINITY_DN795_c0_g1_i2.p1 TRINITY_DN795_c0_g1~~TRINITY_DN795_c0_g1_i2.p1  ORF type:complete len:297 (-),score=68.53 TRINITY_DN795_c0_g1_i2:231-1121(-)